MKIFWKSYFGKKPGALLLLIGSLMLLPSCSAIKSAIESSSKPSLSKIGALHVTYKSEMYIGEANSIQIFLADHDVSTANWSVSDSLIASVSTGNSIVTIRGLKEGTITINVNATSIYYEGITTKSIQVKVQKITTKAYVENLRTESLNSENESGAYIHISWNLKSSSISGKSLTGSKLRRSTTTYPIDITDGVEIPIIFSGTVWEQYPYSSGSYYYTLFIRNEDGWLDIPLNSKITIEDFTPPSNVTNVQLSNSYNNGKRQINVSWENPTDVDLAYVTVTRLRYMEGTNGSVSGYLNPVIIYQGLGNSLIDSDFLLDETYYYQIRAYDKTGNVKFTSPFYKILPNH